MSAEFDQVLSSLSADEQRDLLSRAIAEDMGTSNRSEIVKLPRRERRDMQRRAKKRYAGAIGRARVLGIAERLYRQGRES